MPPRALVPAGALLLTLTACQPQPQVASGGAPRSQGAPSPDASAEATPTAEADPQQPAHSTLPRDLPEGAARPRFSHDGEHLTFHAGPEGARQVYVLTLASGELQNLTKGVGDNRDPDFSPNDARKTYSIVFIQFFGRSVSRFHGYSSGRIV